MTMGSERVGSSRADTGAADRCGNRPAAKGAELCLVRSISSGCRIYRDTVGRYVVLHEEAPLERWGVATLAGAYAACRGWEQSQPNG
ncbi:MAG: hypothetical protein VKO65_09775 [Cyanobacteriota bacterium]|nr:hypothetical protein [Cyanobacteriota bacterium]